MENYAKMKNAEINLKIMGYRDSYEAKKMKVMNLIEEMKELDKEYNKALEELSKRGIMHEQW